jgi:hypothetical protein
MLDTIAVAYKLKLKFELVRRRKQFENSQGTYQVPISIQFRQRTNQTHGIPSKVTIQSISKPQMTYTSLFMIT